MKLPKRRYGQSQTISTVFQQLRKQFDWESRSLETRVEQVWEAVADAELVQNTDRVFVKQHILYVVLSHSALRYRTQTLVPILLQKIQNKLGSNHVKDLRLI